MSCLSELCGSFSASHPLNLDFWWEECLHLSQVTVSPPCPHFLSGRKQGRPPAPQRRNELPSTAPQSWVRE